MTPEEQEHVEKAIAILETAYISGNNVRIEDAFQGASTIIHCSAIPFFRSAISTGGPSQPRERQPCKYVAGDYCDTCKDATCEFYPRKAPVEEFTQEQARRDFVLLRELRSQVARLQEEKAKISHNASEEMLRRVSICNFDVLRIGINEGTQKHECERSECCHVNEPWILCKVPDRPKPQLVERVSSP